MIRPLHRKIVEQACAKLELEGEVLQSRLQRWGYVERIDDLTLTGYRRLIDYFTLIGFRHRSSPILSTDTHALVQARYTAIGASKYTFDTDLRRHGNVGDIRDLDGHNLLNLLIVMEHRGVDLEAFRAARRTITPNQLKVLGMARKTTAMVDRLYYDALQLYGGVNSGADLDARGYSLVMMFMEHQGFSQPGMEDADPGLANRPGFASPGQVRLIETLWAEWAGNTDAAALNAWLERYYRVSALRFLPVSSASKAITALKAMKARGRVREPASA